MKKLSDYEYFRTDLGVLYCGDCLEILSLIEDKVDLILTDPPYGIQQMTYRKNKSRGKIAKTTNYNDNLEWDNKIPNKKIFDIMIKMSKNQIIFGGNYFVEFLYNSSCWIVWDKDNKGVHFADCELAWTNFKTAVRIYKYRWQGMMQEFMDNRKEKRIHPT